jgi:hypothetical protein
MSQKEVGEPYEKQSEVDRILKAYKEKLYIFISLLVIQKYLDLFLKKYFVDIHI